MPEERDVTCNIEPYRDLYPFESRWLDLNGLRYHYIDEGQGEPVIMVHGNPTWSFYFRELIKALRPSYRVIAVDHIGCGLSDKPNDRQYDYRLQQRIDDLGTLLQRLGVTENLTYVVHDWGGMIGLGQALRQPEKVRRLVALNTAAFLLPAGKQLHWQLRLVRNGGPLAAFLVRGLNGFARGATYLACKKGMSAQVRAAYCAPYNSWSNRIATLRFVQDIPLTTKDPSYEPIKWIDDHLHELKDTPLLICWGEADFVFDADFLNEWRRRFPAAEVHTFSDAGHYCLEDAPERIIPLVQDFLARHPLAEVLP